MPSGEFEPVWAIGKPAALRNIGIAPVRLRSLRQEADSTSDLAIWSCTQVAFLSSIVARTVGGSTEIKRPW